MAGHSKFKNIMHRKGAQDKKRSAAFSKLSREITVAAKSGMADPDMNPRLRLAVNNARAASMPKDNIDRAIKKASGADAENYDEVRYEGYAPGGVAIIIEALTDNRNRTAGEIRSYFTKSGGAMAETGAVSFMFDHVGRIEYARAAGSEDAVMEAAIEAGADDVVTGEEGYEVLTSLEALREVEKALESKLGTPSRLKITPYSAPAKTPTSSAQTIASTPGTPLLTDSTQRIAPETPLTEPTERSISPSSMTQTMPSAITPVGTLSSKRFERFSLERNRLLSAWKTTQMTTRPRTTGTAPSSPARTRSTVPRTAPRRPSEPTTRSPTVSSPIGRQPSGVSTFAVSGCARPRM